MPTFDPLSSPIKSYQARVTTGFEAYGGITNPYRGLFCSGFIERFKSSLFFSQGVFKEVRLPLWGRLFCLGGSSTDDSFEGSGSFV